MAFVSLRGAITLIAAVCSVFFSAFIITLVIAVYQGRLPEYRTAFTAGATILFT